ncbi:hypothetical protein NA56DRAFT_703155 [Hyaloscypha hepaticicola]|uniref:Uncharacterized protein n=1 Tax=Hyaloscypha hepaticicola TaxID=2082293 RepID=A0A2J6Q5F4_9HELO|nr:hypothetical protein NA56DRAFT_703155 [Hyaloscypha hepaticicola]
MGTAITLGIITSLSFAVLALQAVMVCANWNLVSTSCAYFSWLFSSFQLSGQQLELLVRSLILGSLGPRMRKEFPIDETALLHGLVGVLAVPFAFVVLGFCGDALEEKREEAEEGIELHQAPTMTGGMKITEGSGSEGSTGLDWCVV